MRLERILHYSNSIEKVTGILARVFMMVRTSTVIKPKSPESLTCSVSVSDWAQGRSLLFMLSMKDTYAAVSAGRLDTLSPFRLREGNPIHVRLWCTSGRIGKCIQPVLGVSELPIVMVMTRVAYLLMVEAHKVLHRGGNDTLLRS